MLYSFQILGHNIYGYSLFWTIGFIAGFIYLLVINAKGTAGKLSYIDLVLIYGLLILSIYYGSKAMGFLYNLFFLNDIDIREMSIQTLDSLYGSNLLYGGVIACVVVMVLYSKLFKVSFKKMLGIYMPFGALFVGFARLGCFSAGCCYGIESRFGYIFPEYGLAPANIRLFPTQMTEAVFGFVLFIVFLILQRRWGEEKSYLTLPIFIVSYCTLSFLLDFVRADTLISILFLTISQWFSLAGIVVVAFWWVKYRKKLN